MTEKRFYVKGSHIKCKDHKGWLTIDEICQILNKQEDLIKRQNEELNKATELLYECDEQFRKYDGRKLFDTSYVEYSEILTKIMAMTK